ncbi:YggS family pyridoxal phosphate-dependent enzyme [Ruminococcaceae bacterium OttesenSCG-928-D13]|nr:YggS family pyridoxal phosphate-dependent enzyme [Ruminococcaceae bacterium OttesenSCG-928-D13]
MTGKSSEGMTIAERVAAVRERMADAAAKAGRPVEEITLVAVTKTRSADEVRAVLEAGVGHIGENRVQELLEKAPYLVDMPHQTHLIGHLQRNKAKYLPGQIDMLQSLSSTGTLAALEKAWAGRPRPLDVLVEVNIGDETSKSGIDAAEAVALCEACDQSPAVNLRGLMAIPPFVEGEKVRPYFEQMYRLFVDIQAKKMDNNTVNVLSMGMSSDFEYAIMEGATMIRVGTELFGPRQYI